MQIGRVIALGFFDGVHLGHGGLLRRTRACADALGCNAMALSFDRHPMECVLGTRIPLICSSDERERLMRQQYHMDEVRFLPFDRAMMALPWEAFLDEILIKELGAVHLVCGHDYRFGSRGEGTAQGLREACASRGIGCDIIDPIRIEGITVSSTQIRDWISEGNVAKARQFLGHPVTLCGTVTHGHAIGRTLGTPTANLRLSPEVLLPKQGVYITMAHTPVGDYPAVTNIGSRPTLNGAGVTVEAWLLDFEGSLYDRPLRLELWEYLRPERKFDSPSALAAEIKNNAIAARAYFAGRAEPESEEL